MPLVTGALELLEELANEKVKAFIVSGTPQGELREIARAKGLSKYFLGILGSPNTKKEILQRVIKEYKFDVEKCIFIGDAVGDFEAAQDAKMLFIGVSS